MYKHLFIIIFSTLFLATAEASSLVINEIHPNPKGKDANKEWIEIKNTSPSTISLDQWSIIINKSPIPLSGEIKNLKTIKAHLKNTNTEIKLISPNNKTVDTISYTKTKESLSLSRVEIFANTTSSAKWLWTTPSKNTPNLSLTKIEGTIDKEITNNRLSIDNTYIHIPPNLSYPLLDLLAKKGKPIEVLTQTSGDNYILYKYNFSNTYNQPPQKRKPPNEAWTIITLAIAILFAPLLYRSYQQHEHE